MKKVIEYREKFHIVGIEVETTNENGKSAEDMGTLWQRFFTEQVSNKISNRTNDNIYVIYIDYTSDFMGVYTAIIGCKVNQCDESPQGLISRTFIGGKYHKFLVNGSIPNAVIEQWQQIWQNDALLNRRYTTDIEVYGETSQNGANSEMMIYLAVD